MQLKVQTYYPGPKSNSNSTDWVETEPKHLSPVVAKKYENAAIRVFKDKDYDAAQFDGLFTLKIKIVKIRSPFIITALQHVLGDTAAHLKGKEMVLLRRLYLLTRVA
jgi:hypothetical protein